MLENFLLRWVAYNTHGVVSRKCSQLSSMAIAKIYLTSWPWISPSDVVSFQNKEAGLFFGPWTSTQENRSSLLCEVITGFHLPKKQAWIVSNWIVKKEYSVQSSTIFWVTFVVTSKNNAQIYWSRILQNSLCLCLFCTWMKQWHDVTK